MIVSGFADGHEDREPVIPRVGWFSPESDGVNWGPWSATTVDAGGPRELVFKSPEEYGLAYVTDERRWGEGQAQEVRVNWDALRVTNRNVEAGERYQLKGIWIGLPE